MPVPVGCLSQVLPEHQLSFLLYPSASIAQFEFGWRGNNLVQSEKRERLIQLAAQIAAKQDPESFRALIVKLKDLLEEKESSLPAQTNVPTKPAAD